MFIASQIIVAISDLVCAISLQCHTKIKLLFFQIIGCVLFSVHYFLLNSYTGAVIALIECFRIIVFYYIDKKKKYSYSIWAGIGFSVISIVAGVFTFSLGIDVLPIIAVCAVNIALIQRNVLYVKIAYIIESIFYSIYMLLIFSYVGAVSEFIVLISGVLGTVSYFLNKSKLEKNKKES